MIIEGVMPTKGHIDDSESSAAIQEYMAKVGAKALSTDFLHDLLPDLVGQFSTLFYKGQIDLLKRPSVSVVGTRKPSVEGMARAKRVTALLVEMGFVVVSGLAKGIDTVAHRTALDLGGLTIAVFGTPIHKIYPAENRPLASEIEKSGLILSPAAPHEETGRYLFPRRNRLMAMITQATIIIEAGETSGVIHQAAECLKQKRKLLVLKSLIDNKKLTWPAGFIKSGGWVVESPDDLRSILLDAKN